jgi:hypothetical protein
MNARPFLVCAAAFALLGVVSCAATAPGAMPRQAPVGPEPRSVEEAQADIDRWSAQLGIAPPAAYPTATAPSGPAGGATAGPADRPAAPSAPPATQAQPTAMSEAQSSTTTAASEPSSECVMPCRAIASMRRSVAALCRLAGEDDPRCVNARKTLDEGERRVARCGC